MRSIGMRFEFRRDRRSGRNCCKRGATQNLSKHSHATPATCRLGRPTQDMEAIEGIRDCIAAAQTGFHLFKAIRQVAEFYRLEFFLVRKDQTDARESFKQRAILTNWDAETIEIVSDGNWLEKAGIFHDLALSPTPMQVGFEAYRPNEEERDTLAMMVDKGHKTFAIFPIHEAPAFSGSVILSGRRPQLTTEEIMEIAYLVSFATKPLSSIAGGTRVPPASLEVRDIEILRMLSEGFTAAQISGKLGLSANAVNYHLRKSLQIMGAATKAHAVAMAIRFGWLH